MALALTVLLGATALAIDGGMGMVRLRQTQNAMDFAALGVAGKLAPTCGGATGISNLAVSKIIADELAADVSNVSWTGQYLDKTGAPIMAGGAAIQVTSTPPGTIVGGACGVALQGSSSWRPTLASVLGVKQMSSPAKAAAVAVPAAVVPAAAAAVPVILALNPQLAHLVYSSGKGRFQVNGDVFANIGSNSPWNVPLCFNGAGQLVGSCSGSASSIEFADSVDAKGGSSISVTGTLSGLGMPLDDCFPAFSRMLPPAVNGSISCGTGAKVAYGKLAYGPAVPPVVTDPLQAAAGPAPTAAGCGGTQTFTSEASPAGPFAPGVYTFPVDVTGAVGAGPLAPTFTDCGGGTPGVYVFQRGINIHPGAGQTVYGANVTFVAQSPIPNSALPGNLGAGIYSGAPNGAHANGASGNGDPNPMPTTGANHSGADLSVAVGGSGTVTLSGPTGGQHAGLLLWQSETTLANFGFDTAATDSSNITLSGNIDNVGPSAVGSGVPYYDDGTPYRPGGILLMGQTEQYGLTALQGTIVLHGAAVVGAVTTLGYVDFLADSASSATAPVTTGGHAKLVY